MLAPFIAEFSSKLLEFKKKKDNVMPYRAPPSFEVLLKNRLFSTNKMLILELIAPPLILEDPLEKTDEVTVTLQFVAMLIKAPSLAD